MLGIKQEALAELLGDQWSQKRISLLEGKEEVDDPLLEEIAYALKVPVEAIKNFDEQVAVNIVSSTFHHTNGIINYNPVFNPLEKWLETLEENKNLYERLLQSEREKVELLQSLIKTK